jgi:hypothetical protein
MLDELRVRARELERNRAIFTAFLEELDETAWTAPVGTENYSPRQTVAHLAGACKSMTRMGYNWIAAKDTIIRPDFDLNFFNARQQEKRAQMPNAALVEEWIAAQKDLIALMETVRPEDLVKRGDHPLEKNAPLRRLFEIVTTHEADHIHRVMDAFSI